PYKVVTKRSPAITGVDRATRLHVRNFSGSVNALTYELDSVALYSNEQPYCASANPAGLSGRHSTGSIIPLVAVGGCRHAPQHGYRIIVVGFLPRWVLPQRGIDRLPDWDQRAADVVALKQFAIVAALFGDHRLEQEIGRIGILAVVDEHRALGNQPDQRA